MITALFNLGKTEITMLVLAGVVLLFGRRLPGVGRHLGRIIVAVSRDPTGVWPVAIFVVLVWLSLVWLFLWGLPWLVR